MLGFRGCQVRKICPQQIRRFASVAVAGYPVAILSRCVRVSSFSFEQSAPRCLPLAAASASLRGV